LPKKDEKFQVPTIERMTCHLCDGDTVDVPGHETENGEVTKCPFVDMNFTKGGIGFG
jgi:hypothetical protein